MLAKSDLLSQSKTKSVLDRMFKETSQLKTTSGVMVASASVQVGQLGGSGAGLGSSVGYGKGEHSTIQGQGSALVSLDTSQSSVEEGLSKDEVGKVIHEHLSEVRYCYESAIIRNPELQGKLMVEFVIAGLGKVKTAKAGSGSLSHESIGDCIVKRLITWNFPKPRGGVDVAVNYPFIFKTLGK